MTKFFSFLMILINVLSNAQIIDFFNPQLKGNVKSAHHVVYFNAGEVISQNLMMKAL
jgi:hypothetical protein